MARCWIVPPFVLEEMVRTGTPEQRAWAIDTISLDQALRASRTHAALLGPTVLPRVPRPGLPGAPRRTIFDAHNTEDALATDVVRAEGDGPVADVAVNEAYDGLGATYDFYWTLFGRDSIDGRGLALDGEVHFGKSFDNAMWDGSRMIFGDGDGQILTRTTAALDVIGHELTHGVTQYTANLVYVGQSGALNESVSDVFGIMIKQRVLGQTSGQSDWLIGEGIVGPALGGRALRSMKAPGTAFRGDPQVSDMRDYVRTMADNGGVHINSGIPNRVFADFAVTLGGYAWERAGRVWYDAIRDPRLASDAQFHDFADATLRQAQRLFGPDSDELRALVDAWRGVGVPVPAGLGS